MKKELEKLDSAASAMFIAFEEFAQRQELAPDLKKECIALLQDTVDRRRLIILMDQFIKNTKIFTRITKKK